MSVEGSGLTFVPHRLAELIPAMTEEEYRELREDIREHGQRENVVMYEGKILDGRHRARACEELGRTLHVYEFNGDEAAAVDLVLSLNVHRRHLTTAQKAEIARRALPYLKKQAKARQGHRTDLEPSGHVSQKSENRAREEAGKLVGVSGRTVQELDHVAQTRPDLHEQVLRGEKGVREAWQESRELQPKVQAVPTELNGKRLLNAQASKKRIETLVGTCQAFERALHELRVEEAAAIASPEERAGWLRVLKAGERSLRGVRERLKGAGLDAAA